MWGLEHAALAYLVILPFFLARKKKTEPELLILIFAFANLPDAMHFGEFRFWLHNSMGLGIATILVLALFKHLKMIEYKHIPILLIAVMSHIVGDMLFSNFYLAFPFDDVGIHYFGWMSNEHMKAGIIVIMLFLFSFHASEDSVRLREYAVRQKKRLLDMKSLKEIWEPDLFVFYLFVLIMIFLVTQALIMTLEVFLVWRLEILAVAALLMNYAMAMSLFSMFEDRYL